MSAVSVKPQAPAAPISARIRGFDPTVWWVLAATLCALAMWVQQLGAPLFLDEGASWYVASQPTLSGFWDVLKEQEVAPPPFYLALRAVVDGLGKNGHASMRLPVVLTTLPLIPLTAVLARQIGASRFGIVAAAWLTALSPALLQYGQQVRAYGPSATAAALAAVLLFHAADRGWTPKRSVVAAIMLGLVPWMHYVAAFPAAIVAVAVLLRAPRRRAFLVVGIAGALWVAAAIFARTQYDSAGAGVDAFTELGGLDLRRVLATSWQGRFDGDEWLRTVGIAALILAAGALALRGARRRAVLLAGLGGPGLIVVVSAVGPDIVTPRYLVPAIPFLLVGLAATLKKNAASVIVLGVLLLAGAFGVRRSLDPSTGQYTDNESLIAAIGPDLVPTAVVASDNIAQATWLTSYVGARRGVAGVQGAWGSGGLKQVACGRRIIRQIVTPNMNRYVLSEWWKAADYRIRYRPLTAGNTLGIADPVPGSSACPPSGPFGG
ncbi:hypothetical protein AB0L40_15280 [Patulibacter sp. NPDC049589]|uniref:hypothetical protein n=1 Tax=Patulibacter sp. NPDC049589 TaxID=3154731 RepID=UPI00343921E6